jgi:hypothetical protein
MGNLPLILDNGFGEDPGGFCGAKKFVDVHLLLSYILTIVGTFFFSLILSCFFSMRLSKFLKQHETSACLDEGRSYTKEIMRVTRVIIILPVLFAGPTIVLTGGQMLQPIEVGYLLFSTQRVASNFHNTKIFTGFHEL